MHSLFDLPRRKTFSKTKTIFGFFCLFCVQALLCCTQFHFQETHRRGIRFRGTQVWTLTRQAQDRTQNTIWTHLCQLQILFGYVQVIAIAPSQEDVKNQDPLKFMLKRPCLKVSCSLHEQWQWCVHGFVCLRFLYGSGSTLGSEFNVSQTGCPAKQDNFQVLSGFL